MNWVCAACLAAAFTRARFGKATRLCVRTLTFSRRLPSGWSLPSMRLYLDDFTGSMDRSDSRPRLWRCLVPIPNEDEIHRTRWGLSCSDDSAIDPEGETSSRTPTMLVLPSCLGNTLGFRERPPFEAH